MARRTIIHRYRRRRKPLQVEQPEQVPEEPIPDNGYDDEAPPIGIDLRTGESIFAGDTIRAAHLHRQDLSREYERRRLRYKLNENIILTVLTIFGVVVLVGFITYLRYMWGLAP